MGNRDTRQMGERGREKREKRLRNFAKLKRKKREGRRETNSKIRQEKLGICQAEEFRTIRFSTVNLVEISTERCLRFRFESMSIDKNGKNETSSPYRRTEHPLLTMNIDFGEK